MSGFVTSSTIVPFRKDRLHDRVVRHLALRVIRDYKTNADVFLPTEADLCRQMEVSRTILREAVKVLAARGLLDVRTKTGMRVRPRREWNLTDPELLTALCEAGLDAHTVRAIWEVREAIEPMAAELAADRATPEEIEQIHSILRRMEETMDDWEVFLQADTEFHQAIIAACHNEFLERMCLNICVALHASRGVTAQERKNIEAAMPLHRAIAGAIAHRDGSAARAATTLLLRLTAQQIDAVLRTATA
jgi:DNA-binding FadR family transcriptional regulator